MHRPGLWAWLGTTVSIGGATSLAFLGALYASTMPSVALSIPVGLVGVFLPLAIGGAAWGAVLAVAVGVAPAAGARRGAKAFGWVAAGFSLPIDAAQGGLEAASRVPGGLHIYYTIVFMIGTAAIGGVASALLTKGLGFDDHRAIGWLSGLGAAIGFLAGSLLAVAVGFPVDGTPYNMLRATLVAVPFSAMGAGAVLGRRTAADASATR